MSLGKLWRLIRECDVESHFCPSPCTQMDHTSGHHLITRKVKKTRRKLYIRSQQCNDNACACVWCWKELMKDTEARWKDKRRESINRNTMFHTRRSQVDDAFSRQTLPPLHPPPVLDKSVSPNVTPVARRDHKLADARSWMKDWKRMGLYSWEVEMHRLP